MSHEPMTYYDKQTDQQEHNEGPTGEDWYHANNVELGKDLHYAEVLNAINGPPYKCQECGEVFNTVEEAERAAWEGCPVCGGVDIDIC